MLLRMEGHETVVCDDGADCLRQAAACQPHVAVLDIGLPGVDGYELARRIRGMDLGHPVMLIAITGYGKPEDVRRAKAAGFDHHLLKPADADEVLALIARHRAKSGAKG